MQKPTTCPLCDAIETMEPRLQRSQFECDQNREDRSFLFRCDRCGDFEFEHNFLADETRDLRRRLKAEIAIRFSGLARAATDARKQLVITAENSDDLLRSSAQPRSALQYLDRLLELLAEQCPYPGASTQPGSVRAYAARVYLPSAAFLQAVELLITDKAIVCKDGDHERMSFSLLPEGWRRAELLRRGVSRGDRAFVAMWFSDSMTETYESGIRPVLEAAGYSPPFRVDDREHDAAHGQPDHRPRIDDRIIAEIRRARFVVADATGARMNVYYEAGYAEALGLPVIWCCREDEVEKMPFDTRQLSHILYKDSEELRKRLTDRVERLGLVRR
ncbi:MAG: hypothetical protein QM778_35205 [Myxococcales bacterium]